MCEWCDYKENEWLLYKSELPQNVRTVQKRPLWRKYLIKRHTDFVFRAESVLFLVGFYHCCKSVCIRL